VPLLPLVPLLPPPPLVLDIDVAKKPKPVAPLKAIVN
jgi:hypothetical protein